MDSLWLAGEVEILNKKLEAAQRVIEAARTVVAEDGCGDDCPPDCAKGLLAKAILDLDNGHTPRYRSFDIPVGASGEWAVIGEHGTAIYYGPLKVIDAESLDRPDEENESEEE